MPSIHSFFNKQTPQQQPGQQQLQQQLHQLQLQSGGQQQQHHHHHQQQQMNQQQPPPIRQDTRPPAQPVQTRAVQQVQQAQGGVRLGGDGGNGSNRHLTPEDIRARGEQIRQNQLRMISEGGPLMQMPE